MEAVKSLIGQSTLYLLKALLSLSPAAEGEPHPEQLLPAHVVLFFPAAGWWVCGERSLADPQSSHRPTNGAWAGQAGLYVRLYSHDSSSLHTECGSHHWPGEPLPPGPIWIHTGKKTCVIFKPHVSIMILNVCSISVKPNEHIRRAGLNSCVVFFRRVRTIRCLTVTAEGQPRWNKTTAASDPSLRNFPQHHRCGLGCVARLNLTA